MFQVSPTPFSCIDWLKFQASEFQKNVSIKKLENKESVQNWVVDMGGGQRALLQNYGKHGWYKNLQSFKLLKQILNCFARGKDLALTLVYSWYRQSSVNANEWIMESNKVKKKDIFQHLAFSLNSILVQKCFSNL